MSFFTDIADFFSGSNKTHDQLNSFVNEKFTFFLNNSNLLLNFVSDFEDYKNGSMQDGKSKCNECEDLYILTNDIFEKYFNKINIPYNIDVSEGTSKTNYKDKVLYFFDLKDLKKILNEENLEKSSSDNTQFNKKRLLCKIISLSFIKIYIIVKSIYQTFNIYNSLITNGNTNNNTNLYEDQYNEPYNPSNSNEFNPYNTTNEFNPYNTTNEFNPYNTTNEFNPSETAEPSYLAPPQETIPEETIPEETIPEETLPEETVPTPITGPVLPPITGQVLPPITGQVLPPITYPVLPPITGPGPTETIPSVPGPIETVPSEIVPPQETVPTETFPTVPGPTETIPTETVPTETDPFEKADLIQENQNKYIVPNQIGPNQIGPNQTGGNMFKNIFDKLLGNKTETTETTETTATTSNNGGLEFSPSPVPNIGTSPEPNLREENNKLQKSDNIFYSIFVILFENSVSEPLDITNFNAKFLTKGLNNMTNETLAGKIPEIIKYIVDSSIFSDEFLGKSCLLFRDDNFKFMNLETSDNESKEATLFVNQVDEEHKSFNKIIETKRTLLKTILNRENREPLTTYSNTQPRQEFANYKFFKSIKSDLKTMIKNYFSSRVNLYNNIVKELFMFDKKTNSIIGLNSKLTYKYISELSKKTEIILLDLHLALFKTLNSILTNSVNEINVMKKSTSLPITEEEYLGGAKTKTHRKRSIKRNIKRNIKRSIKRKRNRTKTRKATNKSYK